MSGFAGIILTNLHLRQCFTSHSNWACRGSAEERAKSHHVVADRLEGALQAVSLTPPPLITSRASGLGLIVGISGMARVHGLKVAAPRSGAILSLCQMGVDSHLKLTRWGCGRKLGLQGVSSCIPTKTEFGRSSNSYTLLVCPKIHTYGRSYGCTS